MTNCTDCGNPWRDHLWYPRGGELKRAPCDVPATEASRELYDLVANMDARLETNESAYQALLGSKTKLEGDFGKLQARLTAAEAKASTLDGEKKGLEAKLTAAAAAKTAAETAKAQADAAKATAEQRATQVAAQLAAVQQELARLKAAPVAQAPAAPAKPAPAPAAAPPAKAAVVAAPAPVPATAPAPAPIPNPVGSGPAPDPDADPGPADDPCDFCPERPSKLLVYPNKAGRETEVLLCDAHHTPPSDEVMAEVRADAAEGDAFTEARFQECLHPIEDDAAQGQDQNNNDAGAQAGGQEAANA